MFGRFVHLHFRINKHIGTNIFMVAIILFTNVFKYDHIFLFKCLYCNLAASKTMIKTLMNENSFHENNKYFEKYFCIYGYLPLVYIFVYRACFTLASKSVLS